jgi:hypothetical protein
MEWATLWAIMSPTHLVALLRIPLLALSVFFCDLFLSLPSMICCRFFGQKQSEDK